MRGSRLSILVLLLAVSLLLMASGCGSSGSNNNASKPSGDPVTITPKTATLEVNQQQQFEAFVGGSSSTLVNWLVNGVPGGNTTYGLISSSGLYYAPGLAPAGGATVTAQSVADPKQSDSAAVTIVNNAPNTFSVVPSSIQQGSGDTKVTVNGGQYLQGAVVSVQGTAIPTTYVSSTQLTAIVPASMLATEANLTLEARNPPPGGDPRGGIPLYVVEGKYVRVGDTNVARDVAATALLPDGKVLVVGGTDENGTVLDSAEIFDPQTNTFQLAGTMTTPRAGPSATLLNNGQVLIAGGNPNPTTAELYDPSTGKFTATPSMNFAHYRDRNDQLHWASPSLLLTDGKVLLESWGANSFPTPLYADVYDPVGNTFAAVSTGSFECHLEFGPRIACGLGVGIVGSHNLAIFNGGVYYFDTTTLSYTQVGQVTCEWGCTVATLTDGRVLVTRGTSYHMGGDSVPSAAIWDSGTNTLVNVSPLGFDLMSTGIQLPNQHVLMAGGGWQYWDRADVFDPNLPQTFVAPVPVGDWGRYLGGALPAIPAVVKLNDGRILVVGGEVDQNNIITKISETYVPQGQGVSKQ